MASFRKVCHFSVDLKASWPHRAETYHLPAEMNGIHVVFPSFPAVSTTGTSLVRRRTQSVAQVCKTDFVRLILMSLTIRSGHVCDFIRARVFIDPLVWIREQSSALSLRDVLYVTRNMLGRI